MTRRWRWAVAALALALPAPAAALDARELVRRVETQYRGQTSHAVARMQVRTEAWTRELRMEMWGRGRDEFVARILEPKKEAGIATLKLGDEIWNYLPKVDRLIKVPSSMMGDGWMGSHLTNDDLVKDDKVEELYDLSVAADQPPQATVVATPKADAAVVWGKIVYRIDTVRLLPLDVDYYDEDGERVRTVRFDDVRRTGGREVPFAMTVVPLDKPQEATTIVYERLEFDVPVDATLFSTSGLRRR